MALTPEDVVNKRFQPTKFREGYDQDEVDDFLDEVVVELRRLGQENEELKQRLVASDSRIAELQRSGGSEAAPAQAQPAQTQQFQAVAEPVAAPVPTPAPAAEASAATPGLDETGSTNNLLQLARRLHEEHVREGIEKRDALIAEGHATAARLVSEAESQQREKLGTLEAERTALESQVEELRTFEHEYRKSLKSYIEGQLHELEGAGSLTPSAPAAAAPAAPAASDFASADFGSNDFASSDFSAPGFSTGGSNEFSASDLGAPDFSATGDVSVPNPNQGNQQPPANFQGFVGN